MSRESVAKMCKHGVDLLKEDGKTPKALDLFREALQKTSNRYEKGTLLCNIALCHHRLENDAAAIESLNGAILAYPRCYADIRRSKEFASLRYTDEFKKLQSKWKGLFVPTWRWYVWWGFLAFLLGTIYRRLYGVSGLGYSITFGWEGSIEFGVKLAGVSLPFAWLVGKVVSMISLGRMIRRMKKQTEP